jgi:hypothetical protein
MGFDVELHGTARPLLTLFHDGGGNGEISLKWAQVACQQNRNLIKNSVSSFLPI